MYSLLLVCLSSFTLSFLLWLARSFVCVVIQLFTLSTIHLASCFVFGNVKFSWHLFEHFLCVYSCSTQNQTKLYFNFPSLWQRFIQFTLHWLIPQRALKFIIPIWYVFLKLAKLFQFIQNYWNSNIFIEKPKIEHHSLPSVNKRREVSNDKALYVWHN